MDLIETIEKESKDKQTNFENMMLIGKRTEKPEFLELESKNPAVYILEKFSKIPRSKLDSILLFLHFNATQQIFHYIHYAVSNRL